MTQATALHIKLLQKSRALQISFSDGKHFEFPCAYLRVNSPSAEASSIENKRHGKHPISLDYQELDVNIISIEPVGQYAVKLIFDDGHNTGIYSWPVLYDLGKAITSAS